MPGLWGNGVSCEEPFIFVKERSTSSFVRLRGNVRVDELVRNLYLIEFCAENLVKLVCCSSMKNLLSAVVPSSRFTLQSFEITHCT